MNITLVRHAQTEENFKGNMQGKRNILLNDTGRRQCNNLRLKLKDKKYVDKAIERLAGHLISAVID